MSIQLPERLFYALGDLENCWSASSSDIRHWLICGDLLAAIWFPVMSVIEQKNDNVSGLDQSKLCHWEGYIQLSGHQCRRLLRHGWITVREFSSFNGEQQFQLPEPADDITIELRDLIILEEERMRFEVRYPSICTTESVQDCSAKNSRKGHLLEKPIDPTFRTVRANGDEYYFGEIQSNIIRLLAEGAQRGKPWQSGKVLLHEAGSQSYSLSNVFKRHPIWRKLIQSDRRGFYRLNEAFLR